MSSPPKNEKTANLYCYITSEVNNRLKIKLKQDGITKTAFMHLMISEYEAGNADIRNVILKMRKEKSIGNVRTRRLERNMFARREENKKDLMLDGPLSNKEIEDLFDILESEIGE